MVPDSNNSKSSDEKATKGNADSVKKPLSGFRRTLSTELLEKEIRFRANKEFNALIESRDYEIGDVIIRKGDTNRDLFLLTEGVIEISTEKEDGKYVLNEIEPPYIIGDIAFMSGFARTATAKAQTKVKIFVLNYSKFLDLFSEFPEWLNPLLTSLVSGIKSLHYKIDELKKHSSGSD